MWSFLSFLEIIVAILLSLCVLVQHRAAGLSATFGGSGAVVVQRRGAERAIYKLTVILGVLFFVIPVLQWYVV